jgi:hypothetical protein
MSLAQLLKPFHNANILAPAPSFAKNGALLVRVGIERSKAGPAPAEPFRRNPMGASASQLTEENRDTSGCLDGRGFGFDLFSDSETLGAPSLSRSVRQGGMRCRQRNF